MRALLPVLGLAAALVFAGGVRSEPSALAGKRAEAAQVLAQIREIDSQLDKVVDAYDRASERLRSLERQAAVAQHRLAVARKASEAAQRNLEVRLVALYTEGDQDLLEVILGSTSLDDLLNRLDAVKRVSSLDQRILEEVRSARAAYARELSRLQAMRAEQRRVVAQRAAAKRTIEARLAERRKLYASIKSEIARLEEQERREQARLKAEAERRLAASPALSAPVSSAGGPTTTAVPASRYGGVVGVAMAYLGVPYRWGGASPATGFDCSGFVMYVFAKVGVSLPHSSFAQYGYGVPVPRDQLEPGDLVFFDGLGHVGIYIGGGQFIHAPHTGDVVKISSISGWYADTYVGARRIL